MSLYIQKFGGTSLANVECIQRVAQKIRDTRQAGHDVVVVVSAMGHDTDRLVELAQSITSTPNCREYDVLLAAGEQVAAAALSLALIDLDCQARAYNGGQAGVLTDSSHTRARITQINTATLKSDLAKGIVPVVTGFQGVDLEGNITTIGRGGSDTTAVWLASALQADECQIYTDVDGVYTSDPRVVKEAHCLSHITYSEMLALARLGAQILQTSSVQLAEQHRVLLRVLSSFSEAQGTLITPNLLELMEPVVSGVAFDRHQAKLTLRGLPSQALWLDHWSAAIQKAAIEVDMMISNISFDHEPVDISFTVSLQDYPQVLDISNELIQRFSSSASEVITDNRIAKLSLIGVGMKAHAGVASKMLHTLEQEGIKIHLITSSEVTVSAAIEKKDIELGAQILHAVFLTKV